MKVRMKGIYKRRKMETHYMRKMYRNHYRSEGYSDEPSEITHKFEGYSYQIQHCSVIPTLVQQLVIFAQDGN